MVDAAAIAQHSEVVGSDGHQVGSVEKVAGDRIELSKADLAAGGRGHAIPLGWVVSVGGGVVRLSLTADAAKAGWEDAG